MIKVARVLCILFMMTTHAWPGSVRVLAADVSMPLHVLYVVVIDALGRAAVPLLSMISGLLFVQTFARNKSTAIFVGKAKTLIVPMAVWSLPLIPIIYASAVAQGQPPPRFTSALEWVNLFFAVTTSPANGPLHFLRDIFIMSVYGIGILSIWRFSPSSGFVAAVFVFLIEQLPGGFLLFRNQIATMYIFGMLLAALGASQWRPSWLLVGLLVGLAATERAVGWLQGFEGNHLAFRVAEHLPRVAMSFLMWRASYAVTSRSSFLQDFCLRYEPHIFTIFCSHAIVFSLFGGIARVSGLDEEQLIYPLVMAAQLALFFVVGEALSRMLKPFPWLRGRKSNAK